MIYTHVLNKDRVAAIYDRGSPEEVTRMCTTNNRASTFQAIITVLVFAVLLLLASCRDGSNQTHSGNDLASFKEMASTASCSEIRNRLFLIDGQQVFWDRAGNCPDGSYSLTLFGSTVDNLLCYLHDSIAGPVRGCRDDRYRDMFDTITANLNKPDLGLGPEHTVQVILF